MEDKKKEVKFTISGLLQCFFINRLFLILMKKAPEYFKEGYRITTVSGSFPYSIWSRYREIKYINVSTISTIIKFYNSINISVNLNFENSQIKEEDLKDTFSNLILNIAHNEKNSLICASKLLENYIRENYPLFKIINNDDTITLNPLCDTNCKYYHIHREYLDKEQINFYKKSKLFLCPLNPDLCFYDLQKNKNFISNEKLEDYIKKGFYNFKIEENLISKNVDIDYSIYDIIESYVYYLIKPEQFNNVRNYILKEYVKFLKKGAEKNNA